MNRLSRNEWSFLAALSFFVACFGLVHDSDQISIWIIHFVDSIRIEDFWKPYRLPPPANGEYGFRPLSVLLMKGYLYFFDAHASIPRSIIFLKAFFSSFFFSWVSLQWFRQSMPSFRACFWSSITTCSGPHLFGLWLLSEFDGLGAAFILLSLLYWKKQTRTNLQSAIMIASCFAAMFLKESTALILFAMLSAGILHLWRKKFSIWKPILWLCALVGLWILLAWELLNGAQTSFVGRYPWQSRLPVLGFTAWQYVYFITPPAIFTILCSLFPISYQKHTTRIALLALLFLPPLTTYNHYESIYFSPLYLGVLCAAVLYFSMIREILFRNHLHATLAFSAQAVLWVAIIGSSTPREDMAVRIFLPALPSLLILLDQKCMYVWKHTRTPKASLILIICSIWPIATVGINALIERALIAPEDHDGVQQLTNLAPDSNELVLFNNFSLSLGNETFLHKESFEISNKGIDLIFQRPQLLQNIEQELLLDIMAHPMCNRTHLFRTHKKSKADIIKTLNELDIRGLIDAQWPPKMHYTPDHLTKNSFPKVMWGFELNEPLDIEKIYQEQQPIWTYWNAKRPKIEIPLAKKGDFSYTRRPMGAMGLLHQAPRDYLPNHNFMEDQHKTQTTTQTTTLQTILQKRGTLRYQSTQSYLQLPVFLHEIPQAALRKWPIFQWYTYHTAIHTVQASPQSCINEHANAMGNGASVGHSTIGFPRSNQ